MREDKTEGSVLVSGIRKAFWVHNIKTSLWGRIGITQTGTSVESLGKGSKARYVRAPTAGKMMWPEVAGGLYLPSQEFIPSTVGRVSRREMTKSFPFQDDHWEGSVQGTGGDRAGRTVRRRCHRDEWRWRCGGGTRGGAQVPGTLWKRTDGVWW